ncbi:nickel-dependent hydrogenase large subunit [Thermovibrio ammonificans HB-1]|uniref:Nickel-dependent hydrogenase large subunit n=1 Tax=Thermovibrio ammonificans (strain DSM 15698 / JCM 12110 / HB-1) TaxID=648996 RepID=E8T2I8_THEA1|nr:nickel-dependent hydrogenase large subunit [Thermovibrio ammonificans]ADU97083.1 nickel-dependent hydrogenase large subunit [Thermovibrio ammonificans HB-1]
MRKVVKLEGIPLTEGHSGLFLEVENGTVKRGFYYALVPVRGFETLLVGKDATVAPVLTSRICGLCQVTHSIAAARAVEAACNIEVPPKAELLRELLGLAVRVYNNLLHQIVVSEDLFPQKDEQLAFIRQVQRIRKVAGELLESIGGEIIHSPNVKVGGVAEAIEPRLQEKLLKTVEATLPLLRDSLESFKEGLNSLWKREGLPEELGKHSLPFFATDRFYGKPVDFNRFQFKMPQELLPGELKRRATNLFPFPNGRAVETGPRARKVLFEGYKPKGGVKELHLLRALENLEAFKRIEEILSEHSFNRELLNRTAPSSDGERLGIGVHEAPRGTNIHAVKVDKSGKIIYYKIVVPTEINFSAIAEALKGAPAKAAEFIVRAYDPCIVCAAH